MSRAQNKSIYWKYIYISFCDGGLEILEWNGEGDQKTRTCPQNRKSLGNEILGGFIKQGQVLVFWSTSNHSLIYCGSSSNLSLMRQGRLPI